MAERYKRTIGAILVLINIIKTNCDGVNYLENRPTAVSKPNPVSHMPGEHLLRGSNERLSSSNEMADFRRDQNPVQQEAPSVFNGGDPHMEFFNTEDGKGVQVSAADLFVDPSTGQMMVHSPGQHSQVAKENANFYLRPKGVALKNLQGYFIPDIQSSPLLPTTELSEVDDNPTALELSSGETELSEHTLPSPGNPPQFRSNPYENTFEDFVPTTPMSNDDLPQVTTHSPNTENSIPRNPDLSYTPESINNYSQETHPQETNETKYPTESSLIEQEQNKEITDEISTGEDGTQTTLPTTINEDIVTENIPIAKQKDDINEEYVYKHAETTSKTNYDLNDENNSKTINNVESITRGSLPTRTVLKTTPKEVPTTISSAESDNPVVVIGARLGLNDELLAPATENSGQRTPKVDKATPQANIDKMIYEIRRPKVKLSKRETLRSWLEDPWLRAPAGILVPLKATSLSRALAIWNEVTEPEGLNLTDVLLIGYNVNGIGWLSRHNLQTSTGPKSVSGSLNKLLTKHQGIMSDNSKGDAALHACAWAAKLVPYDSALFILTDSAPSDAQRLPAALRAMIDKRLKLYTIWTDPFYPAVASQQAVSDLQKASQYTEGEFLAYHPTITPANEAGNLASEHSTWDQSNYRTSSNIETHPVRNGRVDNGIRERVETLLVRRGGGEHLPLGVPVEEGVRSLRVRIDGRVDRAALYPPTGPQIDLFNASSVGGFSQGSRLDSVVPLDAFLLFPTALDDNGESRYQVLSASAPGAAGAENKRKPTTGTWRLSVRCEDCDYRVLVTAAAPIGLDATMIDDDMLRLRVRGPVASVRETVLIDEYGNELAKLPFSHQPSAGEESLEGDATLGDGSGLPALIADVPLLPVTRTNIVFAKVVGRDIHGESFVRLAGPIYKVHESRTIRSATIAFPDDQIELQEFDDISQRLFFGSNNSDTVSNVPASSASSQITGQAGTLLTTVQIGLGSRLYGTPGENLQIHFEVTNYRERSVNFRFEATGNLRFLRGIRPTTQWIAPGQTANVIVDVGITTGAQLGARDLITFTATGLEQVSISAYVYVLNPALQVTDIWAPNVRHVFHGDCMLRQGSDCAQYTWSATIYARDNDGGILRMSSSPIGLRYEGNFISGIREEVMATYRSTCCATRVLVNAVDSNGNANTYTIDISQYLTDAAIAAIVLGILLAIALICVIGFIVYIAVRRRKESRQLPSYATPRRET